MFRYYMVLALRRCRQNLPMVAMVVMTMAIGIASCMTALTIFGALEGEPLPGISSHLHVVTMDAREQVANKDNRAYDKPDAYLKLGDARALVDAGRARQQVALAQMYTRVASSTDGKRTDTVMGLMAYGPVLEMLGVSLRHGRPWTVAEQAARDPVALIDTALATRLFGVENAVGRSVDIGTQRFRVIGVTAPWAPRTQFLDISRIQGNVVGVGDQLFVPVDAALAAGLAPMTSGECGKGASGIMFGSVDVQHCRWLETWVALDTPAQLAGYRQFVAGYADAQHDAGRFLYPPQARLYATAEWMDLNHVVPNDVGLNLGLAAAFLLLCMVNVAGLLAARFLRRQADVAIRRALGASRRHVFAQHLVEAGLLGLLGGLLALPLTLLGLWIVRKQPVAYAEAAHFSATAFVGLLLLSLAVGMVVGVLPAWRICRLAPAMQIKQA